MALDLAAAGLGLAYVEDVVAHHHPAASASRSGRTRAELRNSLRTIWLRSRAWGAVVGTASTAARAVVTATPGRCWKPPPDCAGSRRSGGRFQRVERAVRMLEVQARPTG